MSTQSSESAKPKHPPSAYALFREAMITSNVENESRRLIVLWRNLPEVEKEAYIEEAGHLKLQYEEQMAKWHGSVHSQESADTPPMFYNNTFVVFAKLKHKELEAIKGNERVNKIAELWHGMTEEEKEKYSKIRDEYNAAYYRYCAEHSKRKSKTRANANIRSKPKEYKVYRKQEDSKPKRYANPFSLYRIEQCKVRPANQKNQKTLYNDWIGMKEEERNVYYERFEKEMDKYWNELVEWKMKHGQPESEVRATIAESIRRRDSIKSMRKEYPSSHKTKPIKPIRAEKSRERGRKPANKEESEPTGNAPAALNESEKSAVTFVEASVQPNGVDLSIKNAKPLISCLKKKSEEGPKDPNPEQAKTENKQADTTTEAKDIKTKEWSDCKPADALGNA